MHLPRRLLLWIALAAAAAMLAAAPAGAAAKLRRADALAVCAAMQGR